MTGETIWLIERGLGFINLINFLTLNWQLEAFLFEKGITPVRKTVYSIMRKSDLSLDKVYLYSKPTIFLWNSSDRFLRIFSILGIVLSLLVLFGFHVPRYMLVVAGTLLHLIWLSFHCVCQPWLGLQ